MDLGRKADESQDGRVRQVDDGRFGRAQPGQALRVHQRLRDYSAGPQQASELLDEGADRRLREVAGTGLGEVEPTIGSEVEEPGGHIGGMDPPQWRRPELPSGGQLWQ